MSSTAAKAATGASAPIALSFADRLPDRTRLRALLSIAIPIIGGMLSQNVFNLVDAYMVGRLGDVALAAVGLGSFLSFMCMAPMMGLGAGVQATAARRIGEGRSEEAARPLNGGLSIAVVLGLPWCIASVLVAHEALGLIAPEDTVHMEGTRYLEARLLGVVFIGMNFAFRGYWNAMGQAWFYMGTLVVMHASNILFNWLLIFGNLGFPELGVEGAGVASTVASIIGTATYVCLALWKAREHGFLRLRPTAERLRGLLKLSVPNSVQQLFFATGMTVFMWLAGKTGTAELAASKVLIDLVLVTTLPSVGFGLATTTMVGRALGAENPRDAKRWGYQGGVVAMVLVGLLCVPPLVAPELLLSLFLNTPETIELARTPMRVIAAGIPLEAMGLVLLNAHLGAGNNRRMMQVSIVMQWVMMLPIAYLMVVHLGMGLVALWSAQIIYRACFTIVVTWLWERDSWRGIRV